MDLLRPKPLSQIEIEREKEQLPFQTLGQELAMQKLELAQKDALIQMLGREITSLKLEKIQSKGNDE
ncbi:hypothetical protein [Brevibacillus laterosporus]|uniref:hypothetical protein n=1 Tax=Brevibacillus laterosporus TaxID=1465 RepID=UPI000CE479DC|nr:hypothetical protein [Brevibacillus laterosporus]MED1664565.1 hypothetical protein [Brevibacillus laterosporus]MED1669947.1 hypothetical protein [Brevibacillus laterosporus]MED1717276.1 hypothetical protein [Brevibacillus laterosporus]PPA80662.1 hypothetical protein C4A76_26010 [Brevibacillus laterosporus]